MDNLAQKVVPEINIKRRKVSKYEDIWKFLQHTTKHISKNDFNLLVLYVLKSTIQKLLMCDTLYSIKKTKFLNDFGISLFKYLFSISKNYMYFKIINDRQLFNQFCSSVLNHMIDHFKDIKSELKRDGLRTIYFVSVNPKLPYDLRIKSLSNNQLPIVCNPQPWKFNETKQSLNFGGYLCNKVQFYPGIHLKTDSGETKIVSGVTGNINYLQKMIYRVPFYKHEFNHMFEPTYIYDSINTYLKKVFQYSIINMQDNIVKVHSYSESDFFTSTKANIELAQSRYKNCFFDFIKNINAILLAYVFRGLPLHFAIFMDFRLRIYQTGYPLNIIGGNSIIRDYLRFDPNNDGSCKSIALDASCSGISIIGALIGSRELLSLTNVLVNPENKHIKQDFYLELLKTMKKLYLLEKIETNVNLDPTLVSKVHVLALQFLEIRDSGKYLSMKFAYNESAFTRIKTIKTSLIESWSKKHDTIIPYKEINHIAKCLQKIFVKALETISPNIFIFIKILNKYMSLSIKNQGGLLIKNHLGSIFTLKRFNKKSTTGIYKQGKKQVLSLQTTSSEVDIRSTVRACMANYIHSQDALLMHAVVALCKENDIPVSTIHDSFSTSIKHEKDLISFYQMAFNTCLISNTSYDLTYFFLINGVHLVKETETKGDFKVTYYDHEILKIKTEVITNPKLKPTNDINVFLENVKKDRESISNLLLEKKIIFSEKIIS